MAAARNQTSELQSKLSEVVADSSLSIDKLKAEADSDYNSLLALPVRFGDEIQKLKGKQYYWQRQAFLNQFLISQKRIKNLGRKRLAILHAAGIRSAGDVKGRAPADIPQGVWDDLLNWSRTQERLFAYDPAKPIPTQDITRVSLGPVNTNA